jgi:type IV secretion system protein TrbF
VTKFWKPTRQNMTVIEGELPPGDPITATYLNGRREWDERIGDALSRERTWRRSFFWTLLVLGGSVAGNVYQGTQSKIVPYTVERDRNGDVVAVRAADVARKPDPAHIKAAISKWLKGNRTVYTDVNALKDGINDAYSKTAQNSAAYNQLNEHYRTEDPFERAKRETVSVQNLTALPITTPDAEGRQTWRMEWQEIVIGRDGTLIRNAPWTATVTFTVTPPNTAEQVMLNPDGIFVTEYSWTAR